MAGWWEPVSLEATNPDQLQSHLTHLGRQAGNPAKKKKKNKKQKKKQKNKCLPYTASRGFYDTASCEWLPTKVTQAGPKPHSYLATNNSGATLRRNCRMMRPFEYNVTPDQFIKTAAKLPTPQVLSSTSPSATNEPIMGHTSLHHFYSLITELFLYSCS